MKISQLIKSLEKELAENGDIEVACAGHPGERGSYIEEDNIGVGDTEDRDGIIQAVLYIEF